MTQLLQKYLNKPFDDTGSQPIPFEPVILFPGSQEMIKQRQNMVETQLKGRDIADRRVLKAMTEIPRHKFVDQGLANGAYADNPLPIGFGQTISQPYIVAFMSQALGLELSDRVLEIGSGCGYHSAVLSRLAGSVYTVELIAGLFEKGRENIKKMGLKNVWSRHGDGGAGWPEMAPFTAITVAAYASRRPRVLLEQLSPGGRLIIPMGQPGSQNLTLFKKSPSSLITSHNLLPCRFVPLVGG
ncbi:MAG: protein-L-isoaspartate(D-aspartate) O-methyltransferase [Deltaproteobacteria bacterium]|jgi:protein-L-isoaspartate(D-aspartate) O-methyltransferase|nr:protein-L-isoaspartate(D-aspartate) O-methyltransferase [Deltaproteobacteria bacterium]